MITNETLTHLEFGRILAAISTHAHSDVTRSETAAITPLADPEAIALRSGRIREIDGLANLGIGIRFDRFDDIRPLLELLKPAGAFLSPQDLLVFLPPLRLFRDLSRQFSPRTDIPLLLSIEPRLRPFPDLLEPLEASIDHEGNIKDSASTDLMEIRRAKRALTGRIRKKIEEIVRANDIEIFLQDDFITQRSGRWVIPVRMDSKGMVKGVVHDVSSSGETAFMEPLEIIPFVNELENLHAEEKAEEIRILKQLSQWLREDSADLAACFDTLVHLDLLNSIAAYSAEYRLEPAAINRRGFLRIAGGRHPLLMMLQRQGHLKRVEPLDLMMGAAGAGGADTGEPGDSAPVIVITGPNAGGKTIALKTTGILALMALSGLPVPCDGSRSTFPLLDTILVDIGDDQSIDQSHSTFSAHVARIAAILDQAGPSSLILLDELGAGTEPQQGAAIACGVLSDLLNRGASVIATTHLSEIIGFVHRTQGMMNAGMEYDAATYTPLYRLICGEAGHSHALEIASRFGMPDRIISFAKQMLGTAGSEFTDLLAELRQKRQELDEARHELDRRQRELERKRAELEQKRESLDKARQEVRDKAWNEARELLSTTRRHMNELLEEYRREKRAETLERLRQSEQDVVEALQPAPEAEPDLLPAGDLKAGDEVFVRSLGANAVVVHVDQRQTRARVRAGSIEMEVAPADLARPRPGKKQKGSPAGKGKWELGPEQDAEKELKLIGLRVEEALDLLEPFIDQSARAGIGEVRIIHGLGSGRLRQAVREFLARHPLVEAHRPGDAHEGRDGATVAILRT